MYKITIDKKIKDFWITFCSVIGLLSVIAIILLYQGKALHSDDAMFIFYAKEVVKQHSLFPKGFHYTTELIGVGPSYFMLPFVGLIKNDILLHELGSIGFLLFICICIYLCFREEKRVGAFFIILFLLPISWTYRDMMFFQCAYASIVFWIVFFISTNKSVYNRTYGKRFLLMCCGLVYMNMFGARALFYLIVPAICAYIYTCIESIYIYKKEDKKSQNVKSSIIGIIIICICSLTGLIIYKLLCDMIGFETPAYGHGLLSPDKLVDSFVRNIEYILSLYGYTGTNSLFRIGSIKTGFAALLALVSFICAPIYWMVNLRSMRFGYKRYVILLCLFSQAIQNLYLLIVGAGADRYFLSVIVVDYILSAYMLDDIIEKYNLYEIVIILLTIFSLLFHVGCYYSDRSVFINGKNLIKEITDPTVDIPVKDYLERSGLKYGYASFWNAYPIMLSSNGNIDIAAYDKGNPILPYYFDNNELQNIKYYGVSEDLYNPELHKGKCFVLVRNGEYIPNEYYYIAESINRIGDYQILIFEKNINEYFKIDDKMKSYINKDFDYKYDIHMQELGDFSFVAGNTLKILPNGNILLNSINLYKGKYKLSICTSECDADGMIVYVRGSNGVTDSCNIINDASTIDADLEYLLDIHSDNEGYVLEIINKSDKILEITDISLRYIK